MKRTPKTVMIKLMIEIEDAVLAFIISSSESRPKLSQAVKYVIETLSEAKLSRSHVYDIIKNNPLFELKLMSTKKLAYSITISLED